MPTGRLLQTKEGLLGISTLQWQSRDSGQKMIMAVTPHWIDMERREPTEFHQCLRLQVVHVSHNSLLFGWEPAVLDHCCAHDAVHKTLETGI